MNQGLLTSMAHERVWDGWAGRGVYEMCRSRTSIRRALLRTGVRKPHLEAVPAQNHAD